MISESQEKERENIVKRLNNFDQLDFDNLANEITLYQLKNNEVYAGFCKNFQSTNFPIFLPISAFKNRQVISNKKIPSTYFESSGTTSTINSKHYVQDIDLYLSNAAKTFTSFYGPITDYCFLALLPHYLERQHSSLVCMVEYFIKQSGNEHSGFYLDDQLSLQEKLAYCKDNKIKTILFGVSFALLDFAETYPAHFPDLIIVETGGMKGRREEMTKEIMHRLICNAFGTDHVHSEYGMTELFSQAYSKGNGIFECGKTMKIIITEINDPLTPMPYGKAGLINVIDLANVDSCSFITTEDLGVVHEDGSFTILGRLDQSDLRGCNLLVSDL